MRSGQNGFAGGSTGEPDIPARPLPALIDAVRRHLDMSEADLRIAHWACGGNARQDELSAFLAGEGRLSEREYNILAAAMNDRLIERNLEPSVPYSDD